MAPKAASRRQREAKRWLNYNQLQHALPKPKWVGTNERAARPKTWGKGRNHHPVEYGEQRRTGHYLTKGLYFLIHYNMAREGVHVVFSPFSNSLNAA